MAVLAFGALPGQFRFLEAAFYESLLRVCPYGASDVYDCRGFSKVLFRGLLMTALGFFWPKSCRGTTSFGSSFIRCLP